MILIIVRQIIGIIIGIFGTMFFIGTVTAEKQDGILILLSLLFILLGVIMIFKYPRNNKQLKYKNTKMLALHQAGLPISQDCSCEIDYCDGKFVFKGSGNTFELGFEKITDLCVKTDKEIQTQYVSSIGGAVAGAVVFGPLGAIVGGRAKKKKSTQITYYFIFTYKKDNEISYISFEINSFDASKAIRWASDFNANFRTSQSETVVL